jgi:(2Fe-2S) ferredoxin
MTHPVCIKSSEFSLVGCFLGFAAEEGYRLKYLRLLTATGEQRIKIAKELRSPLYRALKPGMWIQVSGSQKIKLGTGRVKLKAHDVTLIAAETAQQISNAMVSSKPLTASPTTASQATAGRSKPQTILVCQKSDCCKRGGRAIVAALEQTLAARGLTEQVTIKGTGCMKQCKAGPNLVMPDKTRYCRISPREIASLVEQHFPTVAPVTAEVERSASARVAS